MRYIGLTFSICLLATSVWADVIPTRVASKDDSAARGAVADRLEDLGMKSHEARLHTAQLPPEIAEHYAANPAALQWVTGDEDEGPSMEELWIGGVYVFLSVAAIAVPLVYN